MNPFLVWMPSIAAATLLGAAAFLAMYEDKLVGDELPTELSPEAAQAAQQADGRALLQIMEQQLVTAQRVASTMRYSPPTKEGVKQVKSLARQVGLELKKLRQMGNSVPNETFARGEAIVKDVDALRQEVEEAYNTHKGPAAEQQSPAQYF